ncbi:MAG: bifunctional DNA primase/polymerase, partial [Nocardioidaceae bacterium]
MNQRTGQDVAGVPTGAQRQIPAEPDPSEQILAHAIAWGKAGYASVPIRPDGSKAPAGRWSAITEPLTPEQTHQIFTAVESDGLGVICGIGGLEMLELEGRAVDEGYGATLAAAFAESEYGEVWTRLTEGYAETTPSGGLHFYYRVLDPETGEISAANTRGNTKLASRPATEAEMRVNGAERIKVLIETRGRGGFCVTACSGGRTHPTGRSWRVLAGSPETIPALTIAERDSLYAVAATLDSTPEHAYRSRHAEDAGEDRTTERPRERPRERPTERPGDDYNARTAWDDILTPRGWTRGGEVGGSVCWTRPGKDPRAGISATTGRGETDNLYVFSTSTELPTEQPLSKFAVTTLLDYGGDYSACSRALRASGYGRNQESELSISDTGVDSSDSGDDGNGVESSSDSDSSSSSSSSSSASGGGTGVDSSESMPADPRPEIDASSPSDAADWIRENIGTGKLAGMFNRSGGLVFTPRYGEQGYTPPVRPPAADDGPAQVHPVTVGILTATIGIMYQPVKHLISPQNVGIVRRTLFPREAANMAIDRPDLMPGLRHLAGVTHTPLVRQDGSLLRRTGYDQATCLLHLPPANLTIGAVATDPSAEDRYGALALLSQMIEGFDFADANSRANYLGYLLTPLLRQITPAPYKLCAITAPQPGSGKTLLANLLRIIHGGVFRAEMPEDEAELRKNVTTILDSTTGPVIHIDNVTGILRSSALAGLLTSDLWEDRRLGSNEIITRGNDRVWIITGNNVTLGGDLARRTAGVVIDPGVPHPEQRTDFAISDLEGWARSRRGDILAALLTLIVAWNAADRPRGEPTISDGYADWVRTVRGILDHAGVEGIFAASGAEVGPGSDPGISRPITRRDTDEEEWHDFLEAVHTVFGEDRWTVKELCKELDTTDSIAGYAIPRTGRLSPECLPG